MPQVGERWRFKPRLNPEFACPKCGTPYGQLKQDETGAVMDTVGIEVEIIEPPTSGLILCHGCDEFNKAPDGLFKIRGILDGQRMIATVPYTWLEPIADEVQS